MEEPEAERKKLRVPTAEMWMVSKYFRSWVNCFYLSATEDFGLQTSVNILSGNKRESWVMVALWNFCMRKWYFSWLGCVFPNHILRHSLNVIIYVAMCYILGLATQRRKVATFLNTAWDTFSVLKIFRANALFLIPGKALHWLQFSYHKPWKMVYKTMVY